MVNRLAPVTIAVDDDPVSFLGDTFVSSQFAGHQ
jgi:hypothetical protein